MLTFKEYIIEVAKVGLINTDDQIGSTSISKGRDEAHKNMPIRNLTTREDLGKTKRGEASPESEKNVKQIMKHIRKGGKIPPILVRRLNKPRKSGATHQVLDGHHRLEAHKRLGRGSITVREVNKRNISKKIPHANV
jgi:uncharacterized ParB-like nuclease family protein